MAGCTDPLRTRWLYIIGDSSARMLFGALVELVNGTLADPRFGDYRIHHKGGCSHDGTETCLREYVNMRAATRITFSFKTVVDAQTLALDWLTSPSQVPDYFLLAIGAWDIKYSGLPGFGVGFVYKPVACEGSGRGASLAGPVSLTCRRAMQFHARAAADWAESLSLRFTRSSFLVASVVECRGTHFHRASAEYNRWLHRFLPLGPRVGLLDRSASSRGLPFDQTSTDSRSRCTPFHAFGKVVVDDARLAVRRLCQLGSNASSASTARARSTVEPAPDPATDLGPGCTRGCPRSCAMLKACRAMLTSPFPTTDSYYKWRALQRERIRVGVVS